MMKNIQHDDARDKVISDDDDDDTTVRQFDGWKDGVVDG